MAQRVPTGFGEISEPLSRRLSWKRKGRGRWDFLTGLAGWGRCAVQEDYLMTHGPTLNQHCPTVHLGREDDHRRQPENVDPKASGRVSAAGDHSGTEGVLMNYLCQEETSVLMKKHKTVTAFISSEFLIESTHRGVASCDLSSYERGRLFALSSEVFRGSSVFGTKGGRIQRIQK